LEFGNKIAALLAQLKSSIRKWTSTYWNTGDDGECKRICEHFRAELTNKYPESIPIRVDPVPGYHGGGLERSSEPDRGWELFIEVNKMHDTLWVHPTPIGFQPNFGLNDALSYGTALNNDGEAAVHVAVNFYENEAVSSSATDGFFGLRISLALKDGDAEVMRTLNKISELTQKRRLAPSSHTKQDSHDEVLSRQRVQELLFYDAPPNVIVAPTQERHERFTIETS
jgi:hypothetical protein